MAHKMSLFPTNAHRFDPYKNFKFQVEMEIDGSYETVLGVSKVSALKKTIELIEHRHGGDPSTSHKTPGRVKYDAITLEQGVTESRIFEAWANKVWTHGNKALEGEESSLLDFRRELKLSVYNEGGQLVMTYIIHGAWVSEYQPLSELDANANALLIEQVKIECESWERDVEVAILPEVSV